MLMAHIGEIHCETIVPVPADRAGALTYAAAHPPQLRAQLVLAERIQPDTALEIVEPLHGEPTSLARDAEKRGALTSNFLNPGSLNVHRQELARALTDHGIVVFFIDEHQQPLVESPPMRQFVISHQVIAQAITHIGLALTSVLTHGSLNRAVCYG
jgi:hypothetical protein